MFTPKAKSRLAHNKGMIYLKGYGYVERRFRAHTLMLVTSMLALTVFSMLLGTLSQRSHDTEYPTIVVRAFEPISTPSASLKPILAPSSTFKAKEVSVDIDEAVQEFLPTHYSESLMIMHCLAHRENGHNANPNAHGDNGLASGPFQFHEATWVGYRKEMIKQGVATEIGSLYDFKEAARTTAWAIAHKRATAWGPILRFSKGINFATCQEPSWY